MKSLNKRKEENIYDFKFESKLFFNRISIREVDGIPTNRSLTRTHRIQSHRTVNVMIARYLQNLISS
jgi:hypothetical protein